MSSNYVKSYTATEIIQLLASKKLIKGLNTTLRVEKGTYVKVGTLRKFPLAELLNADIYLVEPNIDPMYGKSYNVAEIVHLLEIGKLSQGFMSQLRVKKGTYVHEGTLDKLPLSELMDAEIYLLDALRVVGSRFKHGKR